ncbi:hypothetical protein [Microbacterium sp. 69-10]|uniref:hypothetical protein n=1 Tax=Microbacterium sp. 69-10 TaxID=1895783 RepID=UPI0025DEDD4B|nr:hypothetical protein [Microbacterium sp. 69-10]
MISGVTPVVRAELDQTPEWWDAQYRALERKLIPTDAASHEGHRIVEERRICVAEPTRYCIDCGGVKLEVEYA